MLKEHKAQPWKPLPPGAEAIAPAPIFETTTDGFPILPDPIPCFDKGKKAMEKYFKAYLAIHVCM